MELVLVEEVGDDVALAVELGVPQFGRSIGVTPVRSFQSPQSDPARNSKHASGAARRVIPRRAGARFHCVSPGYERRSDVQVMVSCSSVEGPSGLRVHSHESWSELCPIVPAGKRESAAILR